MKKTSSYLTPHPAYWKHIPDRDLLTETMRDKGMSRAEAFRFLYECKFSAECPQEMSEVCK